MKVIYKGRVPDSYKGKCQHCKSVLEAEAGELTNKGDSTTQLVVGPCPVCTHEVEFYPKAEYEAKKGGK